MKTLALAVLVAGCLAGGSVQAHDVRAGALTLRDLVVRASLGANPNSAAYLTIVNAGARADRLLSVSCACAAKVEAHTSQMASAIMTMRPSGPVVAPAHGSVTFAPGGRHLMVVGLKRRLNDGTMQDMTLRFEHAGMVKAGFHVMARVGAASSMDH